MTTPPLTTSDRCSPPTATRLPNGFSVELAADTRVSRDGRLMLGGSPSRLMRLNPAGARMLRGGTLTVTNTRTATLARTLIDAGIAHPRPRGEGAGSCTIVIPVRDRPEMLGRLLSSLRADPSTADVRILVVDDGSQNTYLTREICDLHGADVLHHRRSLGPAAARNSGLHKTTTDFVAFCDSDVVPGPGWLPHLLAQFEDPAVGLVAPRIIALPPESSTLISTFEQDCSPLDLGPDEALIVPMTKVAYVPSATLVLRRAAAPHGFAAELRVAEDVDLCLRLHAAGWRSRYVASSSVAHDHRTDLSRWVAQRAFYGSGAAALAARHPGQVPPVHVAAWSLLAVALALTGRPSGVAAALGLTGVAAARLKHKMPDADTPVRAALLLTGAGLYSTALQLVRSAVRHHWPVTLVAMALSKRVRRTVAITSTVDTLVERRRVGSTLNPMAYLALRRLDDLAYGAGVWTGALRGRTVSPLLPRIAPFRSSRPTQGRPPTEPAPLSKTDLPGRSGTRAV